MKDWLIQNWFCVFVVALLVAGMLYGHYLGFMRSALALGTLVLTIFLARILLPIVKSLLTGVFHLEQVSDVKLTLIIYLVLLILIFILLKVFIKVTDIVSKIPIIHGLNQIAGAVLGVGLVLIALWFVGLLLEAFDSSKVSIYLQAQIDANKFLTYIFSHNPILTVISKAISLTIGTSK